MRATRRTIQSYEDIEAYRRAMMLLPAVHQLADRLPEFERYELASQLRRASKSIPANMAEGYGKKKSAKEFKAFLSNALGSTNELIVHLRIARDSGYVSEVECQELIDGYSVVGKQINGLMSVWRQFQPPTSNLQRPSP